MEPLCKSGQAEYDSYLPWGWFLHFLSHYEATIHATKWCVEMHDFCMAVLMFLKGHGIKARTHAHAESTQFPPRCTIRTWKALSLQPCASQALMKHLIGKCAISAWVWVLAILPHLVSYPHLHPCGKCKLDHTPIYSIDKASSMV